MALDSQTLLAANNLIHAHGDNAEEHATARLWQARQARDDKEAAKWQELIQALKKVRALRKKVE